MPELDKFTLAVKPTTFTVKEGSRLVYYQVDNHEKPEELWAAHWEDQPHDKSFYSRFENGYLSVYSKIFPRHLPKSGKILEAGCGRGQFVVSLIARGYDCEGIDFADSTVGQIKSIFPELPVAQGNVLDLDYPDASIAAYVSLGVVEHFENGPSESLLEAFQVLRPGGIGIITVPINNPLRWRSALPKNQLPDNARFYQYAFNRAEFSNYLLKAGFSIENFYAQGVHYSLRSGIPGYAALARKVPLFRVLDRITDRTPIPKYFGRTGIWIVRKPG